MKKLMALVLALVMLLSLAACGGGNNEAESDQTQTTAPAPEKTLEKEEPGEVSKPESKEEPKEEVKPVQPAPEQPKEETFVITISHTDVTFRAAGSNFSLTVSPLPANAKVAYASADETIASVSEDGTVTAVGPGTTTVAAKITLTDGTEEELSCIIRCIWTKSVDLNAWFNSFMAGLGEGNAPFMMPLDDELMEVYYPGLTAVARKQTVVQMAGMSAVAFEFALVECENAADVETVRAILQARKDAQVDGGAWYPETIEAWEKAEILVRDNVAALILAGEAQQSALDSFNALF